MIFLHQLKWRCIFIHIHSINVMYYTDWFQMLNYPCIPGMSPTWSRGTISLIGCWIWIAIPYLKIFPSRLKILFGYSFLLVFIWFWYQVNTGLIDWISKYSPPLSNFSWKWYMLANIDCNSNIVPEFIVMTRVAYIKHCFQTE